MTFAFEDINLLLIVLLMLMLRNLLTTLGQVENLKLKFWRDFEPIYLINFEKKLSRLAPRQFFSRNFVTLVADFPFLMHLFLNQA